MLFGWFYDDAKYRNTRQKLIFLSQLNYRYFIFNIISLTRLSNMFVGINMQIHFQYSVKILSLNVLSRLTLLLIVKFEQYYTIQIRNFKNKNYLLKYDYSIMNNNVITSLVVFYIFNN